MNIEKIKKDLAIRVQRVMDSRKQSMTKGSQSSAIVKSWHDKVADTEDLIKKVYDTLNEVLQCNGIQLTNSLEYDSLISDLEPTVHDIVLRNIED
ncbi:hypothetical protein [Nonlabens marinus]|uniref:Uncharacterized protein n=1 Tax=Nonlabens marinus S1-08 TaxID=1454201 RepID=W8VV21_9FLAO|nr:hypothetical protein [Nonlabens marinus]BAO55068.1 hypothetical protein NMS_1059 [Nonlabens marinus S1-08]